ncbi:MAG: hypothetical protein RLZZ323_1630 [Bacteroidota bacterium]
MSLEGYRFGFNAQEKTDEISGSGNHTTALYWEYDSRLGRRWNLDPVYNSDISRYTVIGNNPNYFRDPNGDFKTWFGAAVYKGLHGGEIQKAKTGEHKGEWYVKSEGQSKSNEGGGMYRDVYGRYTSSDINVSKEVSWNWGKGNSANSIDEIAHNVERQIKYLKRNASNFWNSPIARYYVADYYSVGVNFQTSSGSYMNEEVSLTIMLRGKDPGLYINNTTGFGVVNSVGVDFGCNIGEGYYTGDIRKLSSKMIKGWQGSFGVGLGLKVGAGASVNSGVDVGLNNSLNTTITRKFGISVGTGLGATTVQIGVGDSQAAKQILKLHE